MCLSGALGGWWSNPVGEESYTTIFISQFKTDGLPSVTNVFAYFKRFYLTMVNKFIFFCLWRLFGKL